MTVIAKKLSSPVDRCERTDAGAHWVRTAHSVDHHVFVVVIALQRQVTCSGCFCVIYAEATRERLQPPCEAEQKEAAIENEWLPGGN